MIKLKESRSGSYEIRDRQEARDFFQKFVMDYPKLRSFSLKIGVHVMIEVYAEQRVELSRNGDIRIAENLVGNIDFIEEIQIFNEGFMKAIFSGDKAVGFYIKDNHPTEALLADEIEHLRAIGN